VASAEERLVRLEGELLPLARDTFDAGVAAYGTGATNALDVLDALRALTAARLGATALRVEREVAIAELARAVGVSPGELR
jgi:outer membrane protein TolC